MIEIKLIEMAGVVSALKALHLPMGKELNSLTDCFVGLNGDNVLCGEWLADMSKHDTALLRKLIKAGDEHAKVVRGIVAYLDINAPRYWWQEFDTYRIGRETLSSESTMHIQGKGMSEEELVYMKARLLEGTMQRRIVMLSYQTLRRIHHQRHNHRLPEWRQFCDFILTLPLSWIIIDDKAQQGL